MNMSQNYLFRLNLHNLVIAFFRFASFFYLFNRLTLAGIGIFIIFSDWISINQLPFKSLQITIF